MKRIGMILCGVFITSSFAATTAAAAERRLCSDVNGNPVEYLAVQGNGAAHLFARLTLPTSGYTVELLPATHIQSASEPAYFLYCTPPTGPSLPALQEYKAVTSISEDLLDRDILATDANGRQTVRVWAELPSRRYWYYDR